MSTEHLHLNKILDLKKWQHLQDALATVTKLAIITVDYKGNPITAHSSCSPFCESVRKDPSLSKCCQKCDSRGGLEAVRTNSPYIYLCHYNIVDIAIPITIDDKYVGAIMAGQIKISDPQNTNILEQIVSSAKSLEALNNSDELKNYYDKITYLSYKEIEAVADMLSHLCNYIIEEAKDKHLIIDVYEKMFQLQHPPDSPNTISSYNIDHVKQIKKELTNVVTNAYITAQPDDLALPQNKILKPFFDYLYSNKSQNISLKQAAELCHISPSYFSRIFSKQVGENYTNFLARLKIEWSKQLLEKTDISITQISDELGFSNSGYFIKIFKKYEDLTPALYRKYYKEL